MKENNSLEYNTWNGKDSIVFASKYRRQLFMENIKRVWDKLLGDYVKEKV